MDALVNGAELGRLLRPEKPYCRTAVYNMTRRGEIPAGAVVQLGRRLLYSVPKLIDAGWLMPEAAHAPA